MKSSFLLFLLLGALLSTQVLGQTKKAKTKTQTKTTTVPVAGVTAEEQKSSFDKFYERLGIVYFGAITSPTLEDWNANHSALSPEFSSGDPCKNCDTYSANIWSQVNFQYNFGARMKFNVIPRWTTFFDTPSTQGQGQRGIFLIEDALVGFSGVVYSSDDKKTNLWIRPGVRLPTSNATRHGNDKAFGRLTYNIEMLASLTYDFTPKWQAGLVYMDRTWVYDNRINDSRRRMYIAPNFTYTIDDTTKVIAYYEVMLENLKRNQNINNKVPVYKDWWQNAYVGIGKDITKKLNVYPYLSAYVNDVPFSTNSFFLGAWVTYVIK